MTHKPSAQKPSAQESSVQETPPIDVGSEWIHTDGSPNGSSFTVTDIWIDEDGTTRVQARMHSGRVITLTPSDLRTQIQAGDIRRVASAHATPPRLDTTGREWIQVSTAPLRFEYGRAQVGSTRPTGVLAYVEREPANYFSWAVYRGDHTPKAASSEEEAKARALATLQERRAL